MSNEQGRLAELISQVSIHDVRLVGLECGTSVRSPEEAGKDVELSWTHDVSFDFDPNRSELVVHVDTDAKVSPKEPSKVSPDEKAEAAVEVMATFELVYRVPDGLEVSEAEFRSFAETNAVFNVWPYWRELFQAMLTRMGLPAIALPLLRIGGGKHRDAKDSEGTSAGQASAGR